MEASPVMVEDELNGNFVPNPHLQKSQPCTLACVTTSRSSGSSTDSCATLDSKKSMNDLEGKKLNRGISRATDNVNLVSQAREEIIVDTAENQQFFIETPVYTFTLPDLTSFSDEFRTFLEKDLIALSTQLSLEQANRLNWWLPHCQKLWPLSTSGDGNCLLHAASLGMWGFHDRLLTLRKALHTYLSESPRREALWRRWKRQQSILNAQAGLVYSDVEWRREWNAIVNMASSEPRLRRLSIHSDQGGDISGCGGDVYESLEEIHVLALANVLRRPIIVVADTVLKDMTGEALAPIPFGGVYLPLECAQSECHRAPLLLAYDGGHFSALVSMDSSNNALSSAIPLTDINGDLLPIQFSIDPELRCNFSESDELSQGRKIELLSTYLDIIRIDPLNLSPTEESKGLFGSLGKSVEKKLRQKLGRSNNQRKMLLCAVLHSEKRHEYHDVMIKNYLDSAQQRFSIYCMEHKVEGNKIATEGGALRYGAGNSQFYTEAGDESHAHVATLRTQSLTSPDATLYLSNSTFYKDSKHCKNVGCKFFGSPNTDDYCSLCYKLVDDLPLD